MPPIDVPHRCPVLDTDASTTPLSVVPVAESLSQFDRQQMCLVLVIAARRIHELKEAAPEPSSEEEEHHEEICPTT